jgi:predicted nucleic acid-binding protein
VIYLDTSVALAHLLAEDRQPAPALWEHELVSSRLIEYEIWVRIQARRLAGSHREAVGALLGRLSFLEFTPLVLARALEPFPAPVRTFDAIHLASLEFLRGRRVDVKLATFDAGMLRASAKLGIDLFEA